MQFLEEFLGKHCPFWGSLFVCHELKTSEIRRLRLSKPLLSLHGTKKPRRSDVANVRGLHWQILYTRENRSRALRYWSSVIFFRLFLGVLDCLLHEAALLHRYALSRPDYSMHSSQTSQRRLHLHRYNSWALEP